MTMYLYPEKKEVKQDTGESLYLLPDYSFSILKTLMKATRILAVLAVCCFGFALPEAFGYQTDGIGIIQSKNLHFRSKPEQRSPSLMILHKGTKVTVVEYSKGWVKIIHKGQSGYVRNRKKYILIKNRIEKEPLQKTNVSKKIERYQKKAESIHLEIKKSNKEIFRITKKERKMIDRLNNIEMALNTALKNSATIKTDLEALRNATAETRKEIGRFVREIKINEEYASSRLVALYKLNWLGTLHIIASAESFFELSQKKTALERILAYDENILKILLENRTRLDRLLKKQGAQRVAKLSLENEYKKQVRIMKEEKAKRKQLLAKIQNRKSLELAYIKALQKSAELLDLKIKALSQEPPSPTIKKRSMGKPFVEYKGLLNMPVKGKIIAHFGSYRNAKFNVTNFRSGIDIKAERGEPIKAVSSGRIIFSSWFKGYGNMIIIDHGSNYYTVYANIEEIFKKKGSEVETGEVIATVGDTGAGIVSKLYFELRHHGKPVNPLNWIKKS